MTGGAPWRIIVTQENVEKLKPTHAGKEWLSLKAAAEKLKVSQHALLQKIKSAEMEGVRVRIGKRAGWRIYLPVSMYDNQPSLF